MGAIPNKLPGFQDIERDDEARARFEAAWGATIPPSYGWHLTQMFHAMERGELRTLYVIGENPAQSEADVSTPPAAARSSTSWSSRTSSSRRPPSSPTSCSRRRRRGARPRARSPTRERRVQRVRKALDPPGEARDDIWILAELARRLGHDWGEPTAEQVWDELRSLSPMHARHALRRGSRRSAASSGRAPTRTTPARRSCTTRLWAEPLEGPPAPFSVVEHRPPFEALDDEYPLRLTTGRRLESYNTGVQTGRYRSPLHRGESLDLSPEDAERLLLEEGELVRVVLAARRGRGAGPRRPGAAAGPRAS